MTGIEGVLRDLDRRLRGSGTGWALVGGFAVSARAEARFTRDVDLAVAVPDDAAAEAVVRALLVAGYRVAAMVEQDATGRLATARMLPPAAAADAAVADLLFASSGIESEIVAGAEQMEIVPGLVVPVARTGHLIALKLLARDDESRPMDAADLRALRSVADPAEWALARDGVRLISSRGYDRGRDLAAALRELTGGA